MEWKKDYFCGLKTETSSLKKNCSADIAQLVEQLICNQPVVGSSPSIGSLRHLRNRMGEFQSGQMGQTVNLLAKPSEVRILPLPLNCGSSSFGRATAFQAVGGGFEPRFPLILQQITFRAVTMWRLFLYLCRLERLTMIDYRLSMCFDFEFRFSWLLQTIFYKR